MKTLLLTGGTWYIWSHCAVDAIQAGYTIIILDNLANSSREVLTAIEQIVASSSLSKGRIEKSSWIKFYQWDIRNSADIEQVFAENSIDAVLHFAGLKAVWESTQKPFEYYENNVVGTMNLLQVMQNHSCKDIIFSSSATVYNPLEVPPFSEESQTGNTSNPYGTTKFIIENMLRDVALHLNFRVANLRYFNPIGAHSSWRIGENPNDIPNNLLPYLMKVASWELETLSIYGNDYQTLDGTGVRDYIHVSDLSAWHLAALKWLQKQDSIGIFESFNLGTWVGTSVLEMVHMTQDITWKKFNYTITKRRSWDIASAYCNPDKAHEILWWKASKSVKQAIADSWIYISHKNV